MINNLEKTNYINHEHNPTNHHFVVVKLTTKNKTFISALFPKIIANIQAPTSNSAPRRTITIPKRRYTSSFGTTK
jgi:hypothetical protein